MTLSKPKRIRDPKLLAAYRKKPCTVCGTRNAIDAAHIKSRGAGGDDIESNLLSLCRDHHIQQHAIGWEMMTRRYPELERILEEKSG